MSRHKGIPRLDVYPRYELWLHKTIRYSGKVETEEKKERKREKAVKTISVSYDSTIRA